MRKINDISQRLTEKFKTNKVLHPFYALFDAVDAFVLTPATVTTRGAHIRDSVDMKRILITVMIALLPPLLFGFWNVGFQHYLSYGQTMGLWPCVWYGFLKWLPVVLVTYVSGLAVEVFFAQWRGEEVAEGFFVTGMILPMILPPAIPLWIVALATIFTTLFAKEIFGGTGYNFMNPALVARAFIFFAFPAVISGDAVWIAKMADGFTGATPLVQLSVMADGCTGATYLVQHDIVTQEMPSMWDMFLGVYPGCVGETSTLAILIGAAILIVTNVADWRIMLSVVAGGLGMGFIFNLISANPAMAISPVYHLLIGGFMFGAVYMATDPVTAPHIRGGRIVYGVLIGMITVLIRLVNKGYPEGMMLAILLMNVFSPLIDYVAVRLNVNKRNKRRLMAK